MYYGQTSDWRKVVETVTEGGRVSLPAIAAQYTDSAQALRVHCGQEAMVQMHCQFYLASPEDVEAFDAFLQRFGLPRNGYQVVNTLAPYPYAVSEQPLLAPPATTSHRPY